uniref:Ice-binding protein isoform 3 n=1 Tax=Chlamydomonas raudensis TaxID=284013 RepID=L7WZD1_9CHLO|nr:ice-binding protein isoform 3 [Chlamydomonas raudensis]
MRPTVATATLALLLLASTAAAVQLDCEAAGLEPCQLACPDDSPLDACPLDLSLPAELERLLVGRPAHRTGQQLPAHVPAHLPAQQQPAQIPAPPMYPPTAMTFCPFMVNCTGAMLWCMQTLDKTTDNMTFTCDRTADDFTSKYACVTDAVNCTGNVTVDPCAQDAVFLGTASTYAVLAGAGVTSSSTTGAPTTVNGDLGTFPTASVTGFTAGVAASVVTGTIHIADAAAGIAIGDLTIAYNDAAGRTLCPVSVIGNIGGTTIYPGLYKSTSGLEITGSDLTLDALGDEDAVFIFQMAQTFSITNGLKVILAGGAQAKNIFWQVGTSANLEGNTVMEGTLMADQSITSQTGATVNGRVLARIASVTMISATFSLPA